MDEEIRRRRTIDIFARELIRIYGFTGDKAEQERGALASALFAGEPFDYGALGQRAGKRFDKRELRPVLRGIGLPDTEISRLLSGFLSHG